MFGKKYLRLSILAFLLAATAGMTGCHTLRRSAAFGDSPTELTKVNLPEHIIAPPDILLIDAVTLVPRPPYLIKPLDAIFIQVIIPDAEKREDASSLIPGQPISNAFRVEPDGTVNLGFDYGSVKVSGQAIPDAKKTIKKHLLERFSKRPFDVVATLVESQGLQQIRGEHLVEPDGKVTLGIYGTVNVRGLTLTEARAAIQTHLAAFVLEPEISLSIAGFNSRVYYVLFDLDGAGHQVFRKPITGNETVLDAIAELNGLPGGTARKRIWVARPSLADSGCGHVLPVDWNMITSCASTATNYQLMPGDRVYVAVDPWIRADNFLAKALSPIERILGITLLGSSTVRNVSGSQGGVGSGF